MAGAGFSEWKIPSGNENPTGFRYGDQKYFHGRYDSGRNASVERHVQRGCGSHEDDRRDSGLCGKVQSSNVLRIESKVGRAGNLLKGSTGKTLFAWQPEKFINSVLDVGFADSPKGTEEKESLRAELQKIREQGFCVSISEQNEGVASVSVPIRDKSGYAVYSLAVIGEEKRVKQKNMEEIAKVLMDSARGLEGARSQTE